MSENKKINEYKYRIPKDVINHIINCVTNTTSDLNIELRKSILKKDHKDRIKWILDEYSKALIMEREIDNIFGYEEEVTEIKEVDEREG